MLENNNYKAICRYYDSVPDDSYMFQFAATYGLKK